MHQRKLDEKVWEKYFLLPALPGLVYPFIHPSRKMTIREYVYNSNLKEGTILLHT